MHKTKNKNQKKYCWEAQEQFRKNKDFGKPLQQEQLDTDNICSELADFLIRNDIQEEKAKFLANRIADLYGSKKYLEGLCDGIKQEQQEVDLEKEYKEYVEDDPVFSKLTNRNVDWELLNISMNLDLMQEKRNNMEQETLFNILTGQYGEILETHAMWECIASLGIKPFKDGNMWCYLYGDNIQGGICGFGETIYKAAWDFYSNIKTEEKSSKNLKEIAGEWAESETYGKSDIEFEMAYKGFKAGAEWAMQQLKGGQKW